MSSGDASLGLRVVSRFCFSGSVRDTGGLEREKKL